MAEFRFVCSHCGETVVADETSIGQSDKCPFCNKDIIVPNKQESELFDVPSSQSRGAISNQCIRQEASANNKSHGPLYYVVLTLFITLSVIVGPVGIISSCISNITAPQRKYSKARQWYYKQLEYNGLSEVYFSPYHVSVDGKRFDGYCLSLIRDNSVGQTYEINFDGISITCPNSMAIGFAKDLINARIAIYKYDSAQKMQKND